MAPLWCHNAAMDLGQYIDSIQSQLAAAAEAGGDEGGVSRINLRMPDQLKARIEQAAASEGLSVNSWLVRAASSALERINPGPRRQPRSPQGAQRYTGWAR